MSFGILLKGVNAVHFNNMLDLTCEFIPQILFMICTFGYMDFMIIFKWFTHYDDPSEAPSIITLLINMVLSTGTYPDPPLWDNTEVTWNKIFLYTAMICIPWMLVPKPLILKSRMKHDRVDNLHSSSFK